MIDPSEAATLLRLHYGIEATATALACERDATFQIVAGNGRSYTLKVSNPAEAAQDTDFQTEAILWMERADPYLPVPKMVRNLDGDHAFTLQLRDGRCSTIRLLTWLDGVPVVNLGVSPRLRQSMGRTLARLGLALSAFSHPNSAQDIQWDIKNASRLRPLIQELREPDLRRQLLAELDRFDEHVAPLLPGLRQQVIHNDLNLHNVLATRADPDAVSGVLDFGDMVKTPLVIDLAVAASYMTHQAEGAIPSVCGLVSAYHQVLPLMREEVLLLRDLIVARLMTTVAVTEWRAARYPQNAQYILRNNGPARIGLARFATRPRDEVEAALLRACGME